MADVFISYARADREKVQHLAAALEAEGLSLWWDRKLEGGAHFSKDIERELASAGAVMVAWSVASVESMWVLDEAGVGRDAGKLVPVRIDDTLPPLGFRQQHAIDLSGWKAKKPHEGFDDLVASLLAKTEARQGASSDESAPARAIPGQPAPTNAKKRLLGMVALAVILLAAFGGWWMLRGGGESQAVASVEAFDRSKSLAVLPFRDFSPGKDQQWFTDGLADEITSTLSRTPDIIVAPLSAAFAYRDSTLPLPEIAGKLNVTHILNGTVRRSGDQMRITVELVRPGDGKLVWSQTYDRQTDDAIEVQEDIAVQVARALETAMDPQALAEMADIGTSSIEAYEALLKGLGQRSEEDADKPSYEYFREAYTIDPGFTYAHMAAASSLFYRMSYGTFGWSGLEDARERAPLFLEEIEASIKGSEEGSRIREYALAMRDRYYLRMFDTERRLAKIVRRYPNDIDLLQDLAMAQMAIGKFDEAKASIVRHTELNGEPTGWSITQLRGSGFPDEALKQARVAMQGEDAFALDRAIRVLIEAGLEKEARTALEKLNTLGYRQRDLVRLQFEIACTFDPRGEARELLASLPRQEAEDLNSAASDPDMQELDTDEPPFFLLLWGYKTYFDTTNLPKTRAALDKAGIPHDQSLRAPERCTLDH